MSNEAPPLGSRKALHPRFIAFGSVGSHSSSVITVLRHAGPAR